MKNRKITAISKVINHIRLKKIDFFIKKKLYNNKYIRALNYHSTPKNHMRQFENQLNGCFRWKCKKIHLFNKIFVIGKVF